MKRNKLILSFFIGCIALCVASVSMSVAWFATNSRVQVSSFDISIDCDRDLLISTNKDTGYVERINYSEFNAEKNFLPLTSAYSSKWLDNKSDTPLFFDETKYSMDENAVLVSTANRGYFSQKFYIISDDDVYVTLDAAKSFIDPKQDKNKEYAHTIYEEYQSGEDDALKQLTEEEIEERLNKLVNAMRFSILITDEDNYQYHIIDPNKNDETYLGGLLDNDIDYYYDYYQKESDNALYERVYGEIIGDRNNIQYDEPEQTDSGYDYKTVDEEPNAFNARHRKEVKRFNLEKSKEKGVEIKKEEALDINEFKNEVKPFHFPVYGENPTEVVVSIYIEGWDLDSVNYTMGATFISDLSFIIEREM